MDEYESEKIDPKDYELETFYSFDLNTFDDTLLNPGNFFIRSRPTQDQRGERIEVETNPNKLSIISQRLIQNGGMEKIVNPHPPHQVLSIPTGRVPLRIISGALQSFLLPRELLQEFKDCPKERLYIAKEILDYAEVAIGPENTDYMRATQAEFEEMYELIYEEESEDYEEESDEDEDEEDEDWNIENN
jgi:hypothetical protein